VGVYNLETIRKGINVVRRDPPAFLRYALKLVRPMRRDYRRRFDLTLREWMLYHQRTITFDQCSWMGVRALKNPLDAWMYQEIIYRIKPEVIVEIGSAYGGSTLYFAHLLDLIGDGTVVSLDIDRSHYNAQHDRIIEITGDCSAPEIVAQVRQICDQKRVLVIHDGDHHKDAVQRDLELYAPLVSVGSYLIVEDGVVDLFRPGDSIGDFQDGPLPAIEEFVAAHPEFVIDPTMERYIITYNPQGFLKRIR
jgi:cephalosporin hydroxylase